MKTNLSEFIVKNRTYAESVFSEIRRLSASPAPGRGVTRLGYSAIETKVMGALEE